MTFRVVEVEEGGLPSVREGGGVGVRPGGRVCSREWWQDRIREGQT